MVLNEFKKALIDCHRDESDFVYRRVSRQFEEKLFEFDDDDYPEEYFDFVVEILSNEELYGKNGVSNFLLILCTDFDILTDSQRSVLLDVIVSNFINYKEYDLNFTACDFIARSYEYPVAKQALLKMKEIEAEKKTNGYVKEGLITLEKEKERNLR